MPGDAVPAWRAFALLLDLLRGLLVLVAGVFPEVFAGVCVAPAPALTDFESAERDVKPGNCCPYLVATRQTDPISHFVEK